jgi:phytoene synthase
VIQRVLEAADRLYARVGAGVSQLPPGCQPGINAARFLYAEIGREVERAGLDSVSRRAVVPAARKAQLLTRALMTSNAQQAPVGAPPLDETRFLVDAVIHAAPPPVIAVPRPDSAEYALSDMPWWNLHERTLWIIDLFERLERRKQLSSSEERV